MDTAGTAQSSRAMIYYFYADRSWCGYSAAFSPESLPDTAWKPVYTPDGNVIELTIPETAGAEGLSYIRIGAKQIDEDAYITVNEEIE